jgi:uncharacterized lipoprotein
MQRVIKSLLLTLTLVSCASDNDTSGRYHDISYLERPPTLSATSSSSSSRYAEDNSRVEKRTASTGLGEKVYLTNSEPLQLRIRYPIQKAWYALAQALKQSNLKVTDIDRDKKVYYVSSGGESTGGILGFFTGSTPKINYALNLKGSGNETAVMANLAADQEKTPENDPDKILRQLNDIMHDELKLDYNGAELPSQ